MNKTAIKNYAVNARKKWIAAVAQQAAFYGCTENERMSEDEITRQLADRRVFLSQTEKNARNSLVNDIRNHGYQNTIEEVAYTWFNRLIAIRFMEVNAYLPSSIRILSSADSGRIEPDCVREYARLDFIGQDVAAALAAESEDKLYRYILVEQCKALGKIMPKMFTHIAAYAALLLPERLYIKDGLVHDLTHAISEEDFGEQVEIIGWLYQYYISEKKDEVFAALKKNVKITKENIPAATQLFTPDWIVKYMVENSLGRLWLERDRKESGLSSQYMNASYYGWKYYLEEAEQTPEVEARLRTLVEQNPISKPEDIKLIDPCMGSGHILVYAFDVLFQIYQSVGYSERDIPDLILENNIYGLDIDERACQLAYFALMMKARFYNRRFFRREDVPQPQVYAIQDSKWLGGAYQYEMGNFLLSKEHQETLNYLLEAFRDAKEYGSILKLEDRDYQGLAEAWRYTGSQTAENFNLSFWYETVKNEVPLLIEQAILLTQKYDVVVTNPPYMGSKGMGAKLVSYIQKYYPDSKTDIFAVFIETCGDLLKKNGFQAMITMHSWMFLSSYSKLRERLIHKTIINMSHLGARAFDEIGGEVVQTTAFVMTKAHIVDYEATYLRLVDINGQDEKEDAFLRRDYLYFASQKIFNKLPNMLYAYWLSDKMVNAFDQKSLGDVGLARQGLGTSDNNRFLRFWHEVNWRSISFSVNRCEETLNVREKWFPYIKGGSFRRWYPNKEYVVNYQNDGAEIKHSVMTKYPYLKNPFFVVKNTDTYFKKGITWSDVATGNFSARFVESGYIYADAGPMFFPNGNDYSILAYMNSKVCQIYLSLLCQGLHYSTGHIPKVPYMTIDIKNTGRIEVVAEANLSISQRDWDSFETSWDFQIHPLVKFRSSFSIDNGPEFRLLKNDFDSWQRECDDRFTTLKSNEEELNRIFIDIYGLQDELTPEVEDKDVTVRRADLGRDIRSFVSYAVGCMFGRYSLDEPGLIFAGGDFHDKFALFEPTNLNLSQYTQDEMKDVKNINLNRSFYYLKNSAQTPLSCSKVDVDNIIPITDADYFEDDIVMRFEDFVRMAYGEETLTENLDFIASALYPNGNGTAREKIRRYFLNDFFKDHCKIYQKRPIYWLFDSGKQNGFKALIYLHRYDKYTVARVRTEYLHPLQRGYDAEIERMNKLAELPETSARDKAELKKQTEKISKQIAECRVYDQIISHMASQAIALDLDDGVKANYAKFQGVEVPRGDGKGTVKMDLLGKI